MPIRQSVSWWCFAGRGIADDVLLRQAKAIGYEAVELIGENLFEQALGAGLAIASHTGHQSIDRGLNDAAEHDRIEAEIVHNLALAQRHQIPNLIVFSGNRRAGLSEEEGIENTARGLARVSKAAEQAGVNLVLELLNSKVDPPRLPVRPHGLGRRGVPAGRLAARRAAQRHLSYADHGGRRHQNHRGAPRPLPATTTRQASPAGTTSTIRRS